MSRSGVTPGQSVGGGPSRQGFASQKTTERAASATDTQSADGARPAEAMTTGSPALSSQQEAPSASLMDQFHAAVQERRAARRDLNRLAQIVHLEEAALIEIHDQVKRWQDCRDCAALTLRETRAALGMPRFPKPTTFPEVSA